MKTSDPAPPWVTDPALLTAARVRLFIRTSQGVEEFVVNRNREGGFTAPVAGVLMKVVPA